MVSGLVVSAPPTAHQIVQATCRTLGFRPTQAQVGFGVREVAALCAGGFSLTEIGEGARYAAERGWVRSFAGVKFYLPQALKALKKKDHKTTGHETTRPDPHPVRGPVVCRSAPSPHRDLWDQVLGKIEKRIRPQSYRTWFVPTQIGDFDGGRAVLRVPSHLFTDWLKAHYLALIEAAFEEVLGRKAEVFFETPEGGG